MSDLLHLVIKSFFSVYSFQGTATDMIPYYIEDTVHLHGDGEIRTLDPLLARQVLSQLSYAPNLIK